MANVINMGTGGASLINATIDADCRLVYSDGFEVKDTTPTSLQTVSVLFNSLVYAPNFKVSPSVSTGVTDLYLVTEDFQVVKGFDDTFANNSWEDVILACQTNNVPATWNVGDIKTMSINSTECNIQIIGKNHDNYSDGSGKAPLTFQVISAFDLIYQMNKTATHKGGWKVSQMRQTSLPIIMNYLPTVVKDSLRAVNKISSNGTATVETTSDKLFLLSEIEVLGSISDSYSIATGEGTQYEYFTFSDKINRGDGIYVGEWWTRSSGNDVTSWGNASFVIIDQDYYPDHKRANTYITSDPENNPKTRFAFCF